MTGVSYSSRPDLIGSSCRIFFILFLILFLCIGTVDAISSSSSYRSAPAHPSSGHDTFSDGGGSYYASGGIPSNSQWTWNSNNPTSCLSGVFVQTGDTGLSRGIAFSANKYSSSDLSGFQQGLAGWYNPATGQWLTQPGWAGQGTTVYYDPSYGWVSGGKDTQTGSQLPDAFGPFDTPLQGDNVQSSVPVTGWVLDDAGATGSTQTGDQQNYQVGLYNPSTGQWLTQTGWAIGEDGRIIQDSGTEGAGQTFMPSSGLWAVRDTGTASYNPATQDFQNVWAVGEGGQIITNSPSADQSGTPVDQPIPVGGLWTMRGVQTLYFTPVESDSQTGDQTGSPQNYPVGIYNPATGQWLTQPGWAGQGTTVYYDPSYGWVTSGTNTQTGTEGSGQTGSQQTSVIGYYNPATGQLLGSQSDFFNLDLISNPAVTQQNPVPQQVTNTGPLSQAEIQQLREYVTLFVVVGRSMMSQSEADMDISDRTEEIDRIVQEFVANNDPQQVREALRSLTQSHQSQSNDAGES